MKADLIIHGITFKRNIAEFILNLLMAILYAGIAITFASFLGTMGPDLFASLIFFTSIVYLFIFAGTANEYFKQPSRVTITDDKKIIIGKGTKVFDANDVHVEFLKEKITFGSIIIICLMGLLPGIIYFYSSGMNQLIFHCHGEKYEIRYITGRNIKRLFKVLDNRMTSAMPSNDITPDEDYWRNNIRLWNENTVKSRLNYIIYAKVTAAFIITLLLTLVANYYVPKLDFKYGGGLGTAEYPYIIKTKAQLFHFAEQVNKGKYKHVITDPRKQTYFVLSEDIDLNNEEWIPIGKDVKSIFDDYFDGRGHIISNFKITGPRKIAGLFGFNDGTIKNVGVEHFLISITAIQRGDGGYYGTFAGGLAGSNGSQGIIHNSYTINGEVNVNDGFASAGGFVGDNDNEIRDCYTTCNVTASSMHSNVGAGGFLRWNYDGGYVKNCFSTGNVSVTSKNDDEFCLAAGFSTDKYGGFNIFRYEGQVIKRTYVNSGTTVFEPTIVNGKACTLEQLNSKSFYTDTLGWSEKVWDFTNLDFSQGQLPRLRKNG